MLNKPRNWLVFQEEEEKVERSWEHVCPERAGEEGSCSTARRGAPKGRGPHIVEGCQEGLSPVCCSVTVMDSSQPQPLSECLLRLSVLGFWELVP